MGRVDAIGAKTENRSPRMASGRLAVLPDQHSTRVSH
jgi:hypothetical protein